jgi:hypothetical protein
LRPTRTFYYFAIFGAVFGVLALVLWHIWPRPSGLDGFLACLLAASAVNVGCDYALRRPLYAVSGDQGAQLIFFLAGLVATEQALLLFLLVLAGVLYASWLRRGSGGPVSA